MTVDSVEEAERLRQALLRGEPFPPSTKIVSIGELDQIAPSLSKVAQQLAECEISPPIVSPPAVTSTGYVVLQRGGDPDRPCQGTVTLGDRLQKANDMAGELLIGLLAVGLAGFLIAAPFIFHIF